MKEEAIQVLEGKITHMLGSKFLKDGKTATSERIIIQSTSGAPETHLPTVAMTNSIYSQLRRCCENNLPVKLYYIVFEHIVTRHPVTFIFAMRGGNVDLCPTEFMDETRRVFDGLVIKSKLTWWLGFGTLAVGMAVTVIGIPVTLMIVAAYVTKGHGLISRGSRLVDNLPAGQKGKAYFDSH